MPVRSYERVAKFARELNGSLAVIAGHAASARTQLEPESPDISAALRAVDEIARASARAARLTRQLVAEMRAASR